MHPDHRPSPTLSPGVEPPDQSLERRLCDLETRLTHLSRFVDELNEVVTEQSTRLARLERDHAALRGHQTGGGPGPGTGGSGSTGSTVGGDPVET